MSCIFCDIIQGKEKSWTIYQDDFIQAFFDYNPASKGHILIVPKAHYCSIFEIPDELLEKITVFSKKLSIIYKKIYSVEHVNIVNSNGEYAGQEVFHYHMHVVPRMKNDKVHFSWQVQEDIRNNFDSIKNEILTALEQDFYNTMEPSGKQFSQMHVDVDKDINHVGDR